MVQGVAPQSSRRNGGKDKDEITLEGLTIENYPKPMRMEKPSERDTVDSNDVSETGVLKIKVFSNNYKAGKPKIN